MKEKDIIDFEKLPKDEYGAPVDENGGAIACLHCKSHEEAFKKLAPIQMDGHKGLRPLCPICDELLRPFTSGGVSDAIVGEQNSYVPEGRIGLYRCYHCEECGQDYAMMPIAIAHNGNHDTFYTGGKAYAEDKDVKELVDAIAKGVMPAINQYVERKLNPEDGMDRMLDVSNVDLWCSRDIESIVCEWLYNRGMKL